MSIKKMSKHAKFSNKKGFSLVEVMVATALLSVTVGGVMMLVSDNTAKNVFRGSVLGTSSCMAEANRLLSGVKEKSAERIRLSLNKASDADNMTSTIIPLGDATIGTTITPASAYSPAQEIITGTAATDFSLRWPSPVYDFTPDTTNQSNPIIRPHLLIMGYMNALQAMYNGNRTGFCSGTDGLKIYEAAFTNPYPQIFPSPINANLDELSEYVKIQPFTIATGATAACNAVDIRPSNNAEASIAGNILLPPGLGTQLVASSSGAHPTSGAPVFTLPTPAPVNDLGFLVTAKVRFKDRAGKIRECNAQERFQYYADPENALSIDVQADNATDAATNSHLGGFVSVTNLANPPSFDDNFVDGTPPHYMQCSTGVGTNGDYHLKVRNVRPGSIMMCRNLSQQRPSTPNPMYTHTWGVRQLFYSTEIRRTAYYGAAAIEDTSGGNGIESAIAGIYYPGGTYYCPPGAGYACAGLPRFPNGIPLTAGTTTPTSHILNSDYVDNPEGAAIPVGPNDEIGPNPTRYYKPLVGKVRTNNTYKWEPCERIQVCGINPKTAGYVDATASTKGAYYMSFDAIPDGCEMDVQIAEIDAAYNIKTAKVQIYKQERVPGNNVCWTSTADAGVGAPANSWFFACGARISIPGGYNTECTYIAGTRAPLQPRCCTAFPFFKTGSKLSQDY